jgi:hypothetical protein
MDFGTLKSRLLALIGRAPADVCYELVTADINRGLRLSIMEETESLVEAAIVPLPDDFKAVVSIYRDTDPRVPLRPVAPQAMHRAHVASGVPTEYAIVDGELLLNPAPSGSGIIELRYIARLPDLAADGDTNAVLTRYPDIYVYGVLSHHAVLVGQVERAAVWKAEYLAAMSRATAADASDRVSGAPIVPVVRVAP